MLLLRNMKNHNFRHILPRISRSTLTYITSVINFNFVILMRSCHQLLMNKRKCDDDTSNQQIQYIKMSYNSLNLMIFHGTAAFTLVYMHTELLMIELVQMKLY